LVVLPAKYLLISGLTSKVSSGSQPELSADFRQGHAMFSFVKQAEPQISGTEKFRSS
jgi:hypothetical protein